MSAPLTATGRLIALAEAYEPGRYALADGVCHVYEDVPNCCQQLRGDLLDAIRSIEAMAAETARAEAAESALREARAELASAVEHARSSEALREAQARAVAELREACAPFVKAFAEAEEIYRNRGGDPEMFADYGKWLDIKATMLKGGKPYVPPAAAELAKNGPYRRLARALAQLECGS